MNAVAKIAVIGGNNPPSAIDDARTAYKALADYLAQTPVIEAEETAREAKLFSDRTKNTLKDLEAARKAKADPLYAEWTEVNATFKPAKDALDKLLKELNERLTVFARAEETKRQKIAEEKRRAAEEAEHIARAAEEAEREAKDNAAYGEIGVDVGAAIESADAAFADMQLAMREKARAERDEKVRIGGGFDRALSMRTVKTLVLDDAFAALRDLGLTDKVKDAILSGARDYRKVMGALPKGVSEIEERKI